jgi:opacity protein-like surface antigen
MPGRPTVLACALASLLSVSSARAQSNSDPDAQWGVHGGVVSGPDVESVHATLGVHWRPRLTGALGLEVSAGYERLSWAGPGGTVEADHVPVEGSIIFYFLFTRRVQPYLLAGIGYHWVNPHGPGFANGDPYESQNLFGLHGGAGVDVRAGANLSFFLEGRYTFLDVDAVKTQGMKADTLRVAAGVNVAF